MSSGAARSSSGRVTAAGCSTACGGSGRSCSTSCWARSATSAGSLPPALSQALLRGLRTATGRHPEPMLKRLLSVFKAFSLTVDPSGAVALGVDVDPTRGIADSGRFADDLAALFEELGQTARELGVGVLILVDELQKASAQELTALNTAVHHLGQADPPLPLTFVGAGLPSLPAQLAEATSYAERLYDYRPIALLGKQESQDALVVPACNRKVLWSPAGLASATSAAGGYPYFLQAIGKHVWDSARSPIDLGDVEVGLAQARSEVDDGLHRSRWERATSASGTC